MPEPRDRPSTARWLNRSVAWRAVEAELLAMTPDCETCGALAEEAHAKAGNCNVDGPYRLEDAEALCRDCHTATGCPRPPEPRGVRFRWP